MIEMARDGQPLEPAFFARPTLEVARDLLDCRLCRATGNGILRWPITETEAYDGPHDKASHARAGRTRRTGVMFGPPGIWYVYLCYGIHWMLNMVTGPENYPAAILIRGAGEVSGPGRLTRRLGIDGGLDESAASRASGLWIEPGLPVDGRLVARTPRIGVDYAGPDWSSRPYRFVVQN